MNRSLFYAGFSAFRGSQIAGYEKALTAAEVAGGRQRQYQLSKRET